MAHANQTAARIATALPFDGAATPPSAANRPGDLEAFGFGSLEGATALEEASRALGDSNPLGHHVTNALVIADDANEATVRSKGIGILVDVTSGTVVYEDVVRRTPAGWRIARRTVIPRQRPLHP